MSNSDRSVIYRLIIPIIVAVVLLRILLGPALLGIEYLVADRTIRGHCGNGEPWLPNTDLISWWLSGGTATAFEQACQKHDICYWRQTAPRAICDSTFYEALRAGCDNIYDALASPVLLKLIGRASCALQAETYYLGVRIIPQAKGRYCEEQYRAREGRYPPRGSISDCVDD